MLTRCPDCATHFRVTAEQLKARSGRVRCGACQHVFNALDSLIDEPMVVRVAPSAPESAQESSPPSLPDTETEAAVYPEAAAADKFAVPPAPTPEPGPGPLPEALEEVSALHPETPETLLAETIAPLESETAEAETIAPGASESDTLVAEDAAAWSETFPEPLPPPPRRWPWAIGSLAALAALGLQAVLAFRVELAVLMPQIRPALVALCEFADCEVGLPAKVGLVGIDASDLHPDSEHPGRLALTATLKNRAPFAQQFPHLELTLTDTADQAIARKILTPADYLPPTTSIADGMQPNADIMLAVGVEPREMPASGYRLYLFYP
ncbi:MAG: DUF3426 domain-containing protein [Sulfuritalea sp.]|nr:DUF3426 domain-containing protein [Sulfuritalea sp.]